MSLPGIEQASQEVGPQGSFSMEGSLHRAGLSRTSVSFTVDVLSRFMAAGVHPFTLVVGQEVTRYLSLSRQG
jgi:hypothetical protein